MALAHGPANGNSRNLSRLVCANVRRPARGSSVSYEAAYANFRRASPTPTRNSCAHHGNTDAVRPPVPTDQKVGGSNPFGRAQLSGLRLGQPYCRQNTRSAVNEASYQPIEPLDSFEGADDAAAYPTALAAGLRTTSLP